MIARRRLLALAAALAATPAVAQQQPTATTPVAPPAPARRRVRRAAAPPPPQPPPPPARFGDPAPVPNHDLEAPRNRVGQAAVPQLRPALIDPAEPQIGTSRDRASLQAREDRLLRQPAAGARLRLPFEY